MKQSDDDNPLDGIDLPRPENLGHKQELKIPLLSYKRSSRIGLWLLVLPLTYAITVLLKYGFVLPSSVFDSIEQGFKYVSGNAVLTYLIPIIFVGLPLLAMIINLLAFCHFAPLEGSKGLQVTIKYRPVNIAIFLFSFAVLAYAFTPDSMP